MSCGRNRHDQVVIGRHARCFAGYKQQRGQRRARSEPQRRAKHAAEPVVWIQERLLRSELVLQ